MNAKHIKSFFAIYFVLLFVANISCAEFPEPTKKIFDEIYSSGKLDEDSASDLIARINQTAFERQSYKIMALLQVKSSTENTAMLKDAIVLAESYILSGADAGEKNLVKMGLSAIYGLSGERKTGCNLAEELLDKVDFNELAKTNKSYVDYIISRYNIESIGPERFFKDELRRQIGGYYLNRKNDEGGPDLQKARDVFSQITTQEVRDSCLFDARLRGLKQTSPEKSPNTPAPENSPTKERSFEKNSGDANPIQQTHTPSEKQSTQNRASDSVTVVSLFSTLMPWIGVFSFLLLATLIFNQVRLRSSKKPPSVKR